MDQEEKIKQLENENQELKGRVHKLEETINKKLNRIDNAILGDEKMNMKGLAQKVAEHEEHIEYDRRLKNRAGGIITVLLFVISALMAFFNHIASKLLK